MHDSHSHQLLSENSILAALSSEEYKQLEPHLESVQLPLGKKIYDCGDAIDYLYFPLDTVIYLFTLLANGTTVEAGVIGSEGILGISAVLGAEKMPTHALNLRASRALRIKSDVLRQKFNDGGRLQNLILRYWHVLYMQISQTAACNRMHSMEERLSRWLLMTHDRLKIDEITVTQEFISHMLGTQRPYITTAIGSLLQKKAISCCRGHIKITDQQMLRKCACECYGIIQDEFNFSAVKRQLQ